jgi:hypothetical protein
MILPFRYLLVMGKEAERLQSIMTAKIRRVTTSSSVLTHLSPLSATPSINKGNQQRR